MRTRVEKECKSVAELQTCLYTIACVVQARDRTRVYRGPVACTRGRVCYITRVVHRGCKCTDCHNLVSQGTELIGLLVSRLKSEEKGLSIITDGNYGWLHLYMSRI